MFDSNFPPTTQLKPPTIEVKEIGFDFDGVIADTCEAFIRIACTDHGYCSFGQEDITSFELQQCLDIPDELVHNIFTEIMIDSLATGVQPIAGAIDCLEHFADRSTVTIITARPLAQPVSDWFEHYFKSNLLENIRVVATGDHDDKVRHIHQYGLKYFIDDRAETCSQLVEDDITPFVFNQPWNSHDHGLQSVSDWQEIRNLVAPPGDRSESVLT